MTDQNPRTVSASEMARILGRNVSTIGRWIAAGRITAVRLPDGSYLIPWSEVERQQAQVSSIETAVLEAERAAAAR